MKISLGSWAFSFGPYSDHPFRSKRPSSGYPSAGYDGIEICGFPPHITLDKFPSSESRQEIVRFLNGLNLGRFRVRRGFLQP